MNARLDGDSQKNLNTVKSDECQGKRGFNSGNNNELLK